MKRSFRRSGVATALFCFSLTLPSFPQPLVPGASLGDSKYFLDGSKIEQVTSSRKLEEVKSKDIGEVKELKSVEGWDEQLLVVGESGLARLSRSGLRTISETEPEEPRYKIVGSHVLWFGKESKNIEVLGPQGSVGRIERATRTDPFVVDPKRFALVTKSGVLDIFDVDDLKRPKSERLPFAEDDLRIESSEFGTLLWSEKSPQVVLAGHGTYQVQSPPFGVTPVGGAGFVLATKGAVLHLNQYGALTSYSKPQFVTSENFQDLKIFEYGRAVYILGEKDGFSASFGLLPGGEVPGGILGEEKILDILQPPENSSAPPFLFTEVQSDETKVYKNGKVVVNPVTGEEETLGVKGYKLYLLSPRGEWRLTAHEARSHVVGPAQVVGDTLIYATQEEPLNQKGVPREVDGRYPYPKVVLHGASARTGQEVWKYDVERGAAPAVARLPENSEWPLLNPDGPLLFTSEDDRLVALNVRDGKPLWKTLPLPLDESRPRMLRWNDSLGLLASRSTTKSLLLFDESGKRIATIRVNKLFNPDRVWNLLGVLVIGLALVVYIYLAGKKKLFIRRIAGLEALDEAVGRATEMGKPVLYVTGLADVDDIQTLAALSILSHVAKKTAEYDTSILATTSRAVTFSAAQEVVRDAFTIAGRPDSFSIESVRYISDDQFGYAAGVDGLMVREEPAANFYMGKFYAESLIFAETGNATGAIQIAGTAQANQLPFFVAACDYTLIGEELFAASAYLSGDPLQVGSLRGQDVGKAIVMIVLLFLSIDATCDWWFTSHITALLGIS